VSRSWDDSGGDYLTTFASPAALNVNTANGPYSMAIYGNMDNTVDEITPLAKYNGFGPIIRIVNKKVRFFTVDSGSTGREALGLTDTTPGTWQLYGGAWDGSNVMRVTLNGVQDGTTTMGTQAIFGATDWRIGLRNDNVFPWNGLIYYVAIWASYLTDQQWLDLAAGRCPDDVDPLNLRGFWIMDGVDPELDLSGGNNSISLTGSAPFTSNAPTTGCAPSALATPFPPMIHGRGAA
jgi:hypothetical protein